ncbi:E3 ubiquitin-protein ligase TRIM21 [Pholidichthys leucotaenia]
MSIYGSFLTEEQFQCSICLDVFNNPSSTPCGHSFCMACISRYWDGAKICQCPLCKKTFQKRPDLQINRTLREITEQFKSMKGGGGAGGGGAGRDRRGGKGDGASSEDLYNELVRKLPKTRMAQFCDPQSQGGNMSMSFPWVSNTLPSSLPDRHQISGLDHSSAAQPPPNGIFRSNSRRRFTLSGLESSQRIPICETHQRGITMYCKSDQVCICPECEFEDHPDHDIVSVETQWMETKVLLSASEHEIHDLIRQRIEKIEEIKTSVADLELTVKRDTAGSVCLFTTLMTTIERSQAELMEVMEISQRAAELHANTMIRQLEKEIEELRKRESELAKLSQSGDHIQSLKTFQTLSTLPTKDWTKVSVNSDLGTASIYQSLMAQMEKFQEELKNVAEKGFPPQAMETSPARTQPKVKRIQEYALDVTLDSNTAHPRLVLSEDLKSVRCGDRHHLVPDNPERFDRVVCVLGRQAISSGRHYWEVEVGGKTDWDLGVAKQSVNRKGKIDYIPSNGFWFLSLRDKSKYAFRSEPWTNVDMNLRPQKIGIYVDFEKGQVSFYNVDAKIHIYTFNDIFKDSIYPFFSPCTNKSGKNDIPLTITPVNMNE